MGPTNRLPVGSGRSDRETFRSGGGRRPFGCPETRAQPTGGPEIRADGLKGYGFPAPAPDGQRLLMRHFEPGQAPVPVVLPIDVGQGRPATTAPGLWAMPAWR
jgi:hypothetical protein